MFKRGDVIRGTVSSNKDSYGLYDVSIGGPFPFRRIPASRPRHQYFAGMQVLLGFLGTDCPVIISPGYPESGIPGAWSPAAYLAAVLRPEYNFGRSNYLDLGDDYNSGSLLSGTGEQAWQYDEDETLGYSFFSSAGYIYTNMHIYQLNSDGDKTTLSTFDVSGDTGYSDIFDGFNDALTQFFDADSGLIRDTDYTMDYGDEEISANTALDGSTPTKEGYDYSSGGYLFTGGSSYFNNELTPTTRSMLALNYTADGDYALTDIYRQVWSSREYLTTLYLPGLPTFDDGISGGTVSVINSDGDIMRLCHWITGDTFTHGTYGLCYPVNIGYIDGNGALHTITSGVRPTIMSYPTPNFRSLRFLGNRPRYLKSDFSGNYGIILDSPINSPSTVSYSASMLDTHLYGGTIADEDLEYKLATTGTTQVGIRIYRNTPLMADDGTTTVVDVSDYITCPKISFTLARPVVDSAGRIFTAYHDATNHRRGVIGMSKDGGDLLFHYESPKTSNTATNLKFRYFGSLIALVEEDSDETPATYRAVMIRAAAE